MTVTVARECTWSVGSATQWIELTATREGQGDATVPYRVLSNADPVVRRGALTVGEARVDVMQEAAPCRFEISASHDLIGADGGQLKIDVATHTACKWNASSDASWAVPSPLTGAGTGVVDVAVQANAGPARSATIIVAGQPLPLAQQPRGVPPPPPAPPAPNPPPAPPTPPAPGPNPPAPPPTNPAPTPTPPPTPPPTNPAPPPAPAPVPPTPVPPPQCTFRLEPTETSFDPVGGFGTVSVVTAAACEWTASKRVEWVTLLGSGSGTGPGNVRYIVLPNLTRERRETAITIGGAVHRVSQRGSSSDDDDDDDDDEDKSVETSGTVADVTGSCPALRFTVNGAPVETNRETNFRKGQCSQVVNGSTVEVKGRLRGDGVLEARVVELKK